MAIKAMDLDAVTKFVSKDDTGDSPTVWHLGALTSREAGRIRDSVTSIKIKPSATEDDVSEDDIETNIERSKMETESVRLGVRAVDNLQDHNGKVMAVKLVKRAGEKRKTLPDEVIDMLPLSVISELSSAITKANEVAGDDVKN